jgi:hypothetical protein
MSEKVFKNNNKKIKKIGREDNESLYSIRTKANKQ